jgi:hypothetical protein
VPLTERIFARLPGQAWEWMLVWALIAALRPIGNAALLTALGEPDVAREVVQRYYPGQLVFAYMAIAVLWGTRLLWKGATALEPGLDRLGAETDGTTRKLFRGLDSVEGPMVVAIAIAALGRGQDLTTFPAQTNAFDFVYLLVVIIPLGTFIWTYGSVLFAADRLGRLRLALEPFPEDRSLGLRPIGNLAFNGFVIFAAIFVPYMLAVSNSATEYALGLAVFLFALGVFVLSMWRLHLQMAAAKKTYVTAARKLFLEAYTPVRECPTIATVERQSLALQGADTLEKRAEAIQEWPIDDRVFARLAIIVTGVVTSIIAASILSVVGVGR